jgi:hypothetical protein
MSEFNDTVATAYPAEDITPVETKADQLATTGLPEKICVLLPGRKGFEWGARLLLC